jgi:hypothetical protein
VQVIPFTDQASHGGVQDVRGVHTEQRYAAATEIRVYEPMIVPGPLQHPAYTAVIQDFWDRHLRPDHRAGEVAASVASALAGHRRRAALALSRPFTAVIEEAALIVAVGGHDVLEAQLGYLLGLIRDTPSLEVAVIPARRPRPVPPVAPFWILGDTVAMEVAGASLAEDDPLEARRYAALFRSLHGIAVTGSTALELIMSALQRAAEAARRDDGKR